MSIEAPARRLRGRTRSAILREAAATGFDAVGEAETTRTGGVAGAVARFVRVRDWVHFLPLPWVYATRDDVFAPGRLAAAGIAAGCLAYAYGLNRWLDTELARGGTRDSAGHPGSAELSRSVRIVVLVTLGLGALLGAGFLGGVPLAAALASLVGGHVYSAWPRLKAVPLVGTLGNAWIFGPLAFLGTRELGVPPAAPWLAGAFVALLLQNQVVHEAAHRDEDARDGVRTTFVRWGTPVGATLQCAFGLAAAVLLALAGRAGGAGWVAIACGLGALGLTAGVALSGWTGDARRAHRVRDVQRWAGLALGALAWLGCLAPGAPGMPMS